MIFPTISSGKTGTRQVGIALLFLWAFASAYLFFWIGHEQVADYEAVYSTLTTACVSFAFAAFGLTKLVDSGVLGGHRTERRAADKMGQV